MNKQDGLELEGIEEGLELVAGGYDFNQIAEEAAEEAGCKVVYPKENQLQIDIDSLEQLRNFKKRLSEFKKIWITEEIEIETTKNKSKSGGGHYHIYISMFTYGYEDFERKRIPYKIDETFRILLQFALCSDPIRETLNTMRLVAKVKYPTRFFELKEIS